MTKPSFFDIIEDERKKSQKKMQRRIKRAKPNMKISGSATKKLEKLIKKN